MSVIVTKDNFEDEVIESSIPVIVDFYATWCGPCKMLSPILEEIDKEYDDIKVCKVNIDEEEELTNQFEITAVPTLIIFKDGKKVNENMGFISKKNVLELINKN